MENLQRPYIGENRIIGPLMKTKSIAHVLLQQSKEFLTQLSKHPSFILDAYISFSLHTETKLFHKNYQG